MKRRAFTLVEAVVVLAIGGIVWAILWPALHRPLLWSRTPMPPLNFQKMELQAVVKQLHGELVQRRGKGFRFLAQTQWQKPALKHRRVSLHTTDELRLSQVLKLIEKQAGIQFENGGSCGTCALPMGSLRVVDARR